eukprot:scaffold3914_cov121-Cylindrotheca_fusiformis.AAC.8
MLSKEFEEDHDFIFVEESPPRPPPYNPESTRSSSSSSPPAYNPEFVATTAATAAARHDGSNQDSCRSAASAPAQMETVDPTIASILQQGFPPDYYYVETPQKTSKPEEEPSPPPTATATRVHPTTENTKTEHPPGTKANPPSATRYIRTSRDPPDQLWLPYAQIFAWKTKRMSQAAVRKAQHLKRKHKPKVQAMAKRSAVLIKEASQKSLELVQTHGPILKEKVKRASVNTINGIRNFEEKHQVWAKSKRGVKHGSKAMKEVWKQRLSRVR